MAKRIYCFIMDDAVLGDIKKGNRGLAALYLQSDRGASLPITDEEIKKILEGDPDTFVEAADIIVDACAKDVERYR